MSSTRLSVGLSAWDVAGYSTTSVAASVTRAVGVGVLAMSSTRLSVGLSAWDVAGHSTACVATAVALVAASVVAARGVGVGVLTMSST